MTDRESANKSLEQFDRLDLDEIAQRRLAAYALRDFYGSILAYVGRQFLHLEPGIRKRGPKVQWNKVRTRLEAIDDFSVPDEFSKFPYLINDLSNEVDHDFEENPPHGRLEELRENAEAWADWLIEQGEAYQEEESELDVRNTIDRLTRQTLQSLISAPDTRIMYDVDQERLNEDARQQLDKFDKLVEGTEGVTNELVYALVDAKKLEYVAMMIEELEYEVEQKIERRLADIEDESEWVPLEDVDF